MICFREYPTEVLEVAKASSLYYADGEKKSYVNKLLLRDEVDGRPLQRWKLLPTSITNLGGYGRLTYGWSKPRSGVEPVTEPSLINSENQEWTIGKFSLNSFECSFFDQLVRDDKSVLTFENCPLVAVLKLKISQNGTIMLLIGNQPTMLPIRVGFAGFPVRSVV